MAFCQLTPSWVWLTAVTIQCLEYWSLATWKGVGSVWNSCVWAPNCFHSSSAFPSSLQAQGIISIFKSSQCPSRVFKTCGVRFSTPQRPTDAPSSSWDNCVSLPGLSSATHYQLGTLEERFLKIWEFSQKQLELKPTGRSIFWKNLFEIMILSVLLTWIESIGIFISSTRTTYLKIKVILGDVNFLNLKSLLTII